MLALWWRVYRAAARRSERLAKGHLVGAAAGGLALRAHRGGVHNSSCNAVILWVFQAMSMEFLSGYCCILFIREKLLVILYFRDE